MSNNTNTNLELNAWYDGNDLAWTEPHADLDERMQEIHDGEFVAVLARKYNSDFEPIAFVQGFTDGLKEIEEIRDNGPDQG